MLLDQKPSRFADTLGDEYSRSKSLTQKRSFGQFFTPLAIANFMGGLAKCSKNKISILDPGCGSCVLSLSLIEHFISENNDIKSISLTVYEIDEQLYELINTVLIYTKNWLEQQGVTFEYTLHATDFILDNADSLQNLFAVKQYDYIISNPPYFKLPKNDVRVKATSLILRNQPNIYSVFLSIAASLLVTGGELIFIIPRSFTSGSYFKNFREFIFERIRIDFIHLFGSRKSAFAKDDVLQELLILKGTSQTNYERNSEIILSYSQGLLDLETSSERKYKLDAVIDFASKDKILHLPSNDADEYVLKLFKSWSNKLGDFGLQVSTGPVVAFRLKGDLIAIHDTGETEIAPLFWLHNVQKMIIKWPIPLVNKDQYIQINSNTGRWLVPNRNMILIRRFSAKDDKSRLVAAPYFASTIEGQLIGIENKLNYIYSIKTELQSEIMIGVSALLNCRIYDTYFRMFNGNVNVSATELRELTFPPLEEIRKLGAFICDAQYLDAEEMDSLVMDFFNLERVYEENKRSKTHFKQLGVA